MAVMGSDLARNLIRRGSRMVLYSRTAARTDKVIASHGSGGDLTPSHELTDFVVSPEHPRRVILMVKAGGLIGATIDAPVPPPEKGDIVVDGDSPFFRDTRCREQRLRDPGLHFMGAGVPGGEVGALEGPSIMPGGSLESYEALGSILERIVADVNGRPCCIHIGTNDAGHFVRMIRNDIGYAGMRFIGEAYELLEALGLGRAGMTDILATWNTGDLDSYPIEIITKVLRETDPRTGIPLVGVIRDAAGMRGTGTWTVQSAPDLGIPVNIIAESVFARTVSSSPELHTAAQAALHGPDRGIRMTDRDVFVEQVRQVLRANEVVAYAQGLDGIHMATAEYGRSIDIAEVAQVWRTGYIIRARLLGWIRSEYAISNLVTLLEAPSTVMSPTETQEGWCTVVAEAVRVGAPAPGFPAALTHYDQVRVPHLNAALIQGLRDYFGAYTYCHIDDEGAFHANWPTDGTEVTTG